jgi:hypothetical protein
LLTFWTRTVVSTLLQTLALHAKLAVGTVGIVRAGGLVVFDAITILANLAIGALIVVDTATACVFLGAGIVDAGKPVAALIVTTTALPSAPAVLTLASTTKLALIAIAGFPATTTRGVGWDTASITTR